MAPGIFRRGADSSDEGAKIWFSGYCKCHKSRKKSLLILRRGLACSDGAIAPQSSLGPPAELLYRKSSNKAIFATKCSPPISPFGVL